MTVVIGLDLRLAPLAVVVWLGALSGLYLGWKALWIFLTVSLAVAIWFMWLWLSRRTREEAGGYEDWFTGKVVDCVGPAGLSAEHGGFAPPTKSVQFKRLGKLAKFAQPSRQQVSYWWATVATFIVGLGLSTLTAAIHIEQERNDLLSQAMAAESAYIQVTGQIAGMPASKETTWGQEYVSFQLNLTEVSWQNQSQQVSGKVLIQIRESTSDNRVTSQNNVGEDGDKGRTNTGGSNSDGNSDDTLVDNTFANGSSLQANNYKWGETLTLYGRIQELGGVGELRGILTALTVESAGNGNQILQGVSFLKEQLARVAKESGGSGWALIPGMGVGYDEVLDVDDTEAMQIASLSHLTAVSGSHIALTVGMFTAITKPSRTGRAILGTIFMVLILITVGPEPSVLRCVATGMIGAWGMAAAKGGQSLAALFAVIVGTILLQPNMAVSIGFQMSVAATVAILLPGRMLYRKIQQANWLQSFGSENMWINLVRKLLDSLLQMLVISLVCALSVTPMLAGLNDWQPTYGVIANLLAGCAVPMVTICALIAAGTVAWCEPIAALACCISTPFTAWILGVAKWVAQLPGAKCPWPAGTLGVLAGFGLWGLLGLGLLVLYKSKFKLQVLPGSVSQNVQRNIWCCALLGLRKGWSWNLYSSLGKDVPRETKPKIAQITYRTDRNIVDTDRAYKMRKIRRK